MRLRFGEFTLDRATRQLLQAGGARHLEPKAFELLDLLLGRRTKKEETYFALPGAGILRMSADLKQVVLVPTAQEMKGTNLHNTAIWYGPDGTAYLTFPANDAGRVFTTSLGGELLNTLTSPTGDDDLGLPSVRTISRGAARSVTAWSGGVPRSEDYSRPRAARPGRSASERIAGTAMPQHELDLATALGRGAPEEVAALIAAGADVRYKRGQGYDALLDAVHSRDVGRDPRLLDLLGLLVASGADLNGISAYKESGLRVLSHIGRFDAVRLLLDAGADRSQLQWTPLIEAVALGSLGDVERLARDGAALEETDWWSRTAWLVALLAGDLAKAKVLRELGANTQARGRCGKPPLFYGTEGHRPEILRWLLSIGQDVEQADEFGETGRGATGRLPSTGWT